MQVFSFHVHMHMLFTHSKSFCLVHMHSIEQEPLTSVFCNTVIVYVPDSETVY